MTFRQLDYFLMVANVGQITAAAKQLHMAQPPLSYQLKQLESELGVQLLRHAASGVSLTPAGERLRDYAQQLIDLRDQATTEVRGLGQGIAGVLTIGVTSSSIGATPNAKLRTLTRHYPQVQLKLVEANTYVLLDQLAHHQLDVAIVRTPFNAAQLTVKPLATGPMVAVVPPKYDYVAGNTLRLEALQPLPLIIYRRFARQFQATFAKHDLTPFIACTCDDARTAVQWANAQLGVALVPQSVAEQEPTEKTAVRVIRYHAWQTTLKLVWPEAVPISPLLQRFIDSY